MHHERGDAARRAVALCGAALLLAAVAVMEGRLAAGTEAAAAPVLRAALAAGPEGPAAGAPDLSAVRRWLLLLDNPLEPETVDAIRASAHDMVVIDALTEVVGREEYPLADTVAALRQGPGGQRRLVIAYLNIGQIESYRRIWQPGFAPGDPGWIIAEDPDGWAGNYPVAFWDEDWQRTILGSPGAEGPLGRIIAAGFDGVYLDWVAGYAFPPVAAAAAREGRDARAEMVAWIERLGTEARRRAPGFRLIAQNPAVLLEDARFRAAIDGVAQEAIWFTGTRDDQPPGDCPVPRTVAEAESPAFRAGLRADCRAAFDADPVTPMRFAGESYLVPYLALARDGGLPVFTVDYAADAGNRRAAADRARALGFIPFAGLRPLTAYEPPIP